MSSTPGVLTDTDRWLAKIERQLRQMTSVLLNQSVSAGSQPVVAGNGYTISTTTNPNDTLTGPYFSNTISEIVTGAQSYIAGVDFTQSGTSIKWINGNSWQNGQVAIAKK